MLKPLVVALLCTAVACGGGQGGGSSSGVPGGTRIFDLDANQAMDLCEWLADELGPRRTIDCGNGNTAEVGSDQTVAECVAAVAADRGEHPNCPITVAQYEDCIEAIAGRSDMQICEGEAIPDACQLFLDPACQSSEASGSGDRADLAAIRR